MITKLVTGGKQRSEGFAVLDAAGIRRDFPILSRKVNERDLVYLDSAATSQKPRQVIEAMSRFYERHNANPHRGVHLLAGETTAAYEEARDRTAAFVNAPGSNSVVFTGNCTGAINLVAHSWARRNLKPGDEILTTVMEHHSNLVPWQMAARDTGAKVRYIPVSDSGELDLESLSELVNPRTRLLAFSGMSNVLGTINDPAPLVEAASRVGAVTLLDGAQLVPHAPVDFQALGVDFLAFSGHKMLGPTGIGVLVAKPALLDGMEPFMGGGGMILDVTLDGSKWIEPPWRFEAGTPPTAEAVGLAAAIGYLDALGMDKVREREKELVRYALDAFENLDDFRLFGPHDPERRGAVFSFSVGDGRGGIIHPHDVGSYLDHLGIAIRAGHHCCKPLMKRFNSVAMCRASCHVYNTEQEIDSLVDAVRKVRKFFAGA